MLLLLFGRPIEVISAGDITRLLYIAVNNIYEMYQKHFKIELELDQLSLSVVYLAKRLAGPSL